MTEEAKSTDAIGSSGTCVLADPINGTGNYMAGHAVFGTLLALVRNRKTVFGLFCDAILSDWMFALRGEVAHFLHRDGAVTPVKSWGIDVSLDQVSGLFPLMVMTGKRNGSCAAGST